METARQRPYLARLMMKRSLYSLAMFSLLGISAVGCAATSDEGRTESEIRGRQPVSDVTDFLSGGQFGCLAEDQSGREADISFSLDPPRSHRETWFAEGSYQIRFDGGARAQFWSQTRGRPISTVVGGPITVRSGWGRVVCQYDRKTTGPDGQEVTRRFEGEVVRFANECFDERFYLRLYPEVEQGVASGAWLSGRMHWEAHGKREGRQGCDGGSGREGYLGCYTDSEARELPHFAGERQDMTPDLCRSLCRDAGYAFAGAQSHLQCFCGNEIRGRKVSDAECNRPCGGDSRKMCGGAWRNSVYSSR
jgi:hypothetical protein